MKKREKFVSNSSSSSFIVIGQKPDKVNSVKVSKDVAKRIIDFYNEDINELRSKMFDLISKLIETTDEFDTKEMFKNFQNFATIGEI